MNLHTFKSLSNYIWESKTIYDVHAPKLFQFLGEVIEDKRHFYAFDIINQIRKEYLSNHSIVKLVDHGAGSRTEQSLDRSIRQIAKTSSSPVRFGEYLFKSVNWLEARKILELGSNLGIGTSYLAAAMPANGELFSIDADPNLINLAEKAVRAASPSAKATFLKGTFKQQLLPALNALGQVDLAFVDGHHAEQATIDYFNQILPFCHDKTLLIFDDIHWSIGMEKAWATIVKNPKVTASVDLYRWGVVFLDPAIKAPLDMSIVPWKWKPWHMGFFSSRVPKS